LQLGSSTTLFVVAPDEKKPTASERPSLAAGSLPVEKPRTSLELAWQRPQSHHNRGLSPCLFFPFVSINSDFPAEVPKKPCRRVSQAFVISHVLKPTLVLERLSYCIGNPCACNVPPDNLFYGQCSV
jgi:hypothetical protein